MPGKSIVSKSNKLNEMRLLSLPAGMGKAELKIANAIYSRVAPEDEEFKEYTLTISELAGLAGLEKDRLYRNIKRITANLLGTVITIEKPNSRSYLQASVFCTARYDDEDECVYFKIAPDLVPYLLRLKDAGCGFTQYYLEQTSVLDSKHSLRIYELLRQFLPMKKVKEEGVTSGFRRIAVSDLREYLGVQDKYPKFAIFRRDVLEPAQRELAEKTDLCFEFTPERTRRTITSLNFTIRVNTRVADRKNAEAAIDGECGQLSECRDPGLLNQLLVVVPSLAKEQSVLLVNTYSREMILESVMELLAVLSSGQIKTTPAKYLMGILKNKRQDEAQPPVRPERTAEEKLTDRSWAEGLCFDEDWD